MLKFVEITKNFWQAEEKGFKVTRENYGKGFTYCLSIGPQTYPSIVKAIEDGRLSDQRFNKPETRHGEYSGTLEEIQAFIEGIGFQPKVFLEHRSVVIWHLYDEKNKMHSSRFSMDPMDHAQAFFLWELGIGPLGSMRCDRLATEFIVYEWVDAVKRKMCLLIEEGPIVSGVKPAIVEDANAKAIYFSAGPGDHYGHKPN